MCRIALSEWVFHSEGTVRHTSTHILPLGMVKSDGNHQRKKLNTKGKKLSKTDSKKLHIHGNDCNLTPTEIEQLKQHFRMGVIEWIKGGTANDIKMALHDAVNNGVLLLEKGKHFMAILSVNNHSWYTFERKGQHVAICKKTPGSHELTEVARIATIPAAAST